MRTVTLNGDDISQFVSAVPPIKQQMGLPGQVIINEIQTITGSNTTGFWDTRTLASPFYGAEPGGFKLEIFDSDGTRIFDGEIKQIESDASGRTAQVHVRSNLQIALERGCIYLSDEPETPAQAVQNILALYEIPIESGAFAQSSKVYTDADIFLTCKLINPEMSVLQTLQSLADIGVAALSSTAGTVRFDAYRFRTGTAAYTFSDDLANADGVTLWQQPRITSIDKPEVEGYNIETGSVPAIFGPSEGQAKSIQAGNEAPITLVSTQAGVGVGELWLEYSNRPQDLVEWQTRLQIGRDLVLGYPVALDYTTRDWAPVTVDLTLIDVSSQAFAMLQGVTR